MNTVDSLTSANLDTEKCHIWRLAVQHCVGAEMLIISFPNTLDPNISYVTPRFSLKTDARHYNTITKNHINKS